MGNGNDSILEAYLFETNSLLEQLDSLVLAAEEKEGQLFRRGCQHDLPHHAHGQRLLSHDGI